MRAAHTGTILLTGKGRTGRLSSPTHTHARVALILESRPATVRMCFGKWMWKDPLNFSVVTGPVGGMMKVRTKSSMLAAIQGGRE